MDLHIIVCTTANGGIGAKGGIPWHYAEDLKHFRKATSARAPGEPEPVLIMGRKTWDSIGHALPNRHNVVLSRTQKQAAQDSSVEWLDSLDQAITKYKTRPIFVIGGEQIYRECLTWYSPRQIWLTKIINYDGPECDTFFPMELVNQTQYEKTRLENSTDELEFWLYKHQNHEEQAYLNLFRQVLGQGQDCQDRTGTGTRSIFAPRLEFSLENQTIPVFTTKRVAFQTLCKELLWFISGSTDTKILERQGVKIWTGNTTRTFLDSRGLTSYREGELGPGYGFQWRHAGAQYQGLDHDYTGEGVDQLQAMVDMVKNNPTSRRILMSAWNVADLNQMALPPCHLLYQLYVRRDPATGQGYLSAQMYQRSADSFLGVGFNVTSYALLTHIIAQICGLKAERLVMCFGDYHIYKDHIEQVQTQLSRQPRPFPKLKFHRQLSNINDLSLDDFSLVGYFPDPAIKAKMSV